MPSKKWLSIQEIAPLFHRPIVDVAGAPPPIETPCHSGGRWRPRTSPLPHPLLYPAATLGVCTTVLKKVCRRHGIRRWPQRKLQSLNKLINNLHNAMKSTNGAARSPLLPVADARTPRVRHTPLVWRRRQHTSAHPSRPLPSSCGGAPAPRLRDR